MPGRQERRQDMSEPSEVRPEVVEAILGVLKGGRPRGRCLRGPPRRRRPPRRTPTCRSSLAERGKRDRQSQAWELLLNPQLRRGAELEADLRRPRPVGARRTRHPLRRPAGRRPGGVRAPLRGPVRRLIPDSPHPMTRPVTTPGRLVAGRYRLQSQIGGGGMGTVWLARDELLGRQVAIKQVLTAAGRQRRGGRPAAAAGAARGPDRRPAEPSARDLASTTSRWSAASRGWSWSTCRPAASRRCSARTASCAWTRSPRSAPRWPTRWPPPTPRGSCTAT